MRNVHPPNGLSRRDLVRVVAAGALATVPAGCATPVREPAVPLDQTVHATVLGVPNERFFPIYGVEPMQREYLAALERIERTRGLGAGALPDIEMLAVSGGGENGAFGAGLLCGWSEQGSRPVFDVVTGVSTGALTAPFAYLGRDYDPQLRAVYTGLKPNQVMEPRGLLAALYNDAMTDNAPLFQTISRYVTEEMAAAIARAYEQGRLLLIGTTDLDAQQPVIWNIGAMAASNHPRAVDTIRRILLASAAIPGVFPPTMFDVTLDGRPYQEMHVDGGAINQVFLYPAALGQIRAERIRRGDNVPPMSAYVIRNARLDPEWAMVERQTMGIAQRAISTMIMAGGYFDVVRMYNLAARDGIDFNLAFIGPDFTETLPSPFDPGFMNDLFRYGFERGRNGYPWAKRPPV